MNPTEELKAEHEGILQMLKILKAICGNMASNKPIPKRDLQRIIEFLKVFVDQCHHAKEEEILFPALEAVGIPREGGPIGVLLNEHKMGRDLVKRMEKAFLVIDQGAGEFSAAFLAAAKQYIDLLEQHIHKENTVLFPMSETRLTVEKQSELKREFDRVEKERIGEGRHDAFHRLLEELISIYMK